MNNKKRLVFSTFRNVFETFKICSSYLIYVMVGMSFVYISAIIFIMFRTIASL